MAIRRTTMRHTRPTRPDRWLALPVAALTLIAGCNGHHRSSMRPIYVSAPPAATVVAPSSCPAGARCGAVTGSPCPAGSNCTAGSSRSAGFSDGETLVPTPAGETPVSSPAPSRSSEPPLDPKALEPTTRSTAPPAKAADEPGDPPQLEPITPTSAPGLEGPRASTSRRPATARTASLADQVRSLANDPDDLVLPPKADRAWKYIVVHHSAHPTGSYAQIDHDHRARLGTAGCGYHFVIGNGSESPDGLIEVAQRWSDQKAGAHCRDSTDPAINDYGIGICLVGDLDNGELTPKQIESARVLVAYLRQRYQIPVQNAGTHAQLTHAATACPGKNFPVAAVLGGNSSRGLAAR